MGDLQIKKQAKQYDVVIVGSGAGGGMAAYTLAKAGFKICIIEAGYMYDPQKNITQLKHPGILHAAAQVLPCALLVILMPAMVAGAWRVNPIPKKKVPTGYGGGPGCWAEEPITGAGFLCALAQKILKEKVLMAWVMIGPLVTKT